MKDFYSSSPLETALPNKAAPAPIRAPTSANLPAFLTEGVSFANLITASLTALNLPLTPFVDFKPSLMFVESELYLSFAFSAKSTTALFAAVNFEGLPA